MNRNSSFLRDLLYDRRQCAEFIVGQPDQCRKVDLDPTVIRRQSVDPIAALDAVFVGVEIDFEVVQ
ncbi:hypothetical protein J0664_24390 (plasmid) [Rhizobium leguminosarum]|nr:hypothetical protein J0664_24390 [Rhizobium leguminosarum]